MEGDEVWPASHSSLSRTAVRSSRAKLQHHSCRSRHHVRPQRLAHDPGTHISRGGCTATSAGAGTAQVRDRASSMHARVQRCSPGAPHRHAARHGRRPPQRSTGAPRLSARHTSAARGRAACRAAPAAPPRAARPAAPRPQRAPRPRRSSSAARSRPRPSPPARRCARAVSTPQVRALALRAPAPSTESGTPKPSSLTRASPRMPGSQRPRVTPPLQQAPRRSRWCWPARRTACGPSARRPPAHRCSRSSGPVPTAGRPGKAQQWRHGLRAPQQRRLAGHGSLPAAQCRPSEAAHAPALSCVSATLLKVNIAQRCSSDCKAVPGLHLFVSTARAVPPAQPALQAGQHAVSAELRCQHGVVLQTCTATAGPVSRKALLHCLQEAGARHAPARPGRAGRLSSSASCTGARVCVNGTSWPS